MKVSDLPAGPAPGTGRAPRLIGRVPAHISLADRYRLAVARANLLGLLEQDRRLPALFAEASKHLGLRPRQRQLGQQVKHKERALWAVMRQISERLGLPWSWVAHDLLVLYLSKHLGLVGVVSNTERPPFEEPAPKRVRLSFATFPGATMADARRMAAAKLDEQLTALADDSSRAPREGARYLSEAVYWFYLRRCLEKPRSETGLAKQHQISRARVRKSVREVERLFSLIRPVK